MLRSRYPKTRELFKKDFDWPGEGPDPLHGFFDRPYWGKLWIVQEILLAKDPIILCGNAVCSWRNVCYNHLLRRSVRDRNSQVVSNFCWYLHKNEQKGEEYNVWHLFNSFSMQHCTLPQDLVFALLGLILNKCKGPEACSQPTTVSLHWKSSMESFNISSITMDPELRIKSMCWTIWQMSWVSNQFDRGDEKP
jgi:hypothetical protein